MSKYNLSAKKVIDGELKGGERLIAFYILWGKKPAYYAKLKILDYYPGVEEKLGLTHEKILKKIKFKFGDKVGILQSFQPSRYTDKDYIKEHEPNAALVELLPPGSGFGTAVFQKLLSILKDKVNVITLITTTAHLEKIALREKFLKDPIIGILVKRLKN